MGAPIPGVLGKGGQSEAFKPEVVGVAKHPVMQQPGRRLRDLALPGQVV